VKFYYRFVCRKNTQILASVRAASHCPHRVRGDSVLCLSTCHIHRRKQTNPSKKYSRRNDWSNWTNILYEQHARWKQTPCLVVRNQVHSSRIYSSGVRKAAQVMHLHSGVFKLCSVNTVIFTRQILCCVHIHHTFYTRRVHYGLVQGWYFAKSVLLI